MKIVSGGQTGVDRAALDVALDHGISCGGWCSAGRLDELGRIPDRYPVRELAAGGSAERTLQNVIDSDATVIIHRGELRGGTKYTVQCCVEQQKRHLVIDSAKTSADVAGELIHEFVRQGNIETLNVAGPRQTEWQHGYRYACDALKSFARNMGRAC